MLLEMITSISSSPLELRGVPKGVQISHDNLVSFNTWMQTDFGLASDGICLSQPPYSFDLSVMDLYPTLTAGRQLTVLPKETTDNFKELFAVLPKLHVSEWVSTPHLWIFVYCNRLLMQRIFLS